jgi:hypothetical protein
MTCPKCGSENVLVTSEQVGAKTSKKGSGCLWSIGRGLLVVFTLGAWRLVGKHKGQGKTKIKNSTVAICQNCGNKWNV